MCVRARGETPLKNNSKPLRGQSKSEGLSPSGPLKLSTLAEVRTEMARMYRLALKRTIEPDEASKFTYILREIRQCLETEDLNEIKARLAALTSLVEVRRYG